MAETKYTYSISSDFPNQKVNIDLLSQEIEDSSIVTDLSYITTDADVCDIWFVDALSGGDQTTLNGLVTSHQGTDTTSARQSASSSGVDSTTSTSYQNKLNSTLSAVKKGIYTVSWYCEVKLDTGGLGDSISVRITVDDVEKALSEYGQDHASYTSFTGTLSLDFVEAETPNIKLQYKRIGDNGDTVYIRSAQISTVFQY